jgi:hypothetical protein
MRWTGIQEFFGAILASTDVFTGPAGKKRLEDLHTRVTEHVSLSITLETTCSSLPIEHSCYFRILLSYLSAQTNRAPIPKQGKDRGNSESARCFRHSLGQDRQTGRNYQFPAEEERGRRDERLVFRYEQDAWLGGEGMDGNEC